MDLPASTFPLGHVSPSRADGKPQEAPEGFRQAFNSLFISAAACGCYKANTFYGASGKVSTGIKSMN